MVCRVRRKRVWDFLLVLNGNLGPILPRFVDITEIVYTKSHIFHTTRIFRSKFLGVPFGADP